MNVPAISSAGNHWFKARRWQRAAHSGLIFTQLNLKSTGSTGNYVAQL